MATLLDEADRVEADLGSLDEADRPQIDAMSALGGCTARFLRCGHPTNSIMPPLHISPLCPGEELSVAVHMQSHEGLPECHAAYHAEPCRSFEPEAASDIATEGVGDANRDPDDELPDMSGMKMHEKVALRAAYRRKMKLRAQKPEEGAAAAQEMA